MMDPTERLLVLEDIRTLKARYWRAIDFKRWDDWRACFTTDAVFEFPETGGSMGFAEFIPWSIAFLDTSTSIHHGYAPDITFLSSDEAKGIWAFDDQIYWPGPTPANQGLASLQGSGYYHDLYRRGADGWRIARVQVTRLRLTTTAHQLTIS